MNELKTFCQQVCFFSVDNATKALTYAVSLWLETSTPILRYPLNINGIEVKPRTHTKTMIISSLIFDKFI